MLKSKKYILLDKHRQGLLHHLHRRQGPPHHLCSHPHPSRLQLHLANQLPRESKNHLDLPPHHYHHLHLILNLGIVIRRNLAYHRHQCPDPRKAQVATGQSNRQNHHCHHRYPRYHRFGHYQYLVGLTSIEMGQYHKISHQHLTSRRHHHPRPSCRRLHPNLYRPTRWDPRGRNQNYHPLRPNRCHSTRRSLRGKRQNCHPLRPNRCHSTR